MKMPRFLSVTILVFFGTGYCLDAAFVGEWARKSSDRVTSSPSKFRQQQFLLPGQNLLRRKGRNCVAFGKNADDDSDCPSRIRVDSSVVTTKMLETKADGKAFSLQRRRLLLQVSSTIIAGSILLPVSLTPRSASATELLGGYTTETTAATATPSVSEGDLAISEPPPNRAVPTIIPSTKTSSMDPRYFVAGGSSAAFSHGITTPVDVVKTKMQADPQTLGSMGLREATRSIIENEGGPAVLLGGLGPTVVGYGIEGALKFGVYESLKPSFFKVFQAIAISNTDGKVDVDPAQPYLAAAVCAGALASLVLCPMEETRIRLVTDPSFGKGLFDGLPRLLREEGWQKPFEGLPAMLSKQVPYTMGKQVSFDVFAAYLYSLMSAYAAWLPSGEIALGVEIGAAFLASIVACLASHPGDVILTATYKGGSSNGSKGDMIQKETSNSSFGKILVQIYNEEGISGFFRGLSARFIHVGCIITFQLVVYNEIKTFLGVGSFAS